MKKPKNYYCHKSQSFQSSLPLNQNIQIVQKIGQGAFGEVFKVFDINSSQLKVVKLQKKQASKEIFNKQNEIMKKMSGSQGFAKVKQFYSQNSKTKRFQENENEIKSSQPVKNKKQNQKIINNQQKDEQNEIIVMECLGQNLGKIIEKKCLSVFSMKRIAHQLILRLKQLHEKGYVHRDLKPQNILLGNQLNPHKIYLVDFGLVSTFRKNPTKIRKVYEGVIGTAKFCPLASHLGNQQFPCDDLQSLGYVLVYLVHGQLPWKFNRQQKISDQQKFQRMKSIKQSISIQSLVRGINCLKKYFQFIRKLKGDSEIDYRTLVQLFQIQKDSQQYCFQFCKQRCNYKIKRQMSENQIQNEQNQNNQSYRKISIQDYQFSSKFIKK